MENQSWQDIFNYGVPMAILAALGFATWRIVNRIMKWALGDDSVNPPMIGYMTRKIESSQRRDERMIEFIDSMDKHTAQQRAFCNTHAASLARVADIIQHDVVGADNRSKALEDLLALHTDKTIQNSTAAAIDDVCILREAFWRYCIAGRELAAELDFPRKQEFMERVDAIERLLNRNKGTC